MFYFILFYFILFFLCVCVSRWQFPTTLTDLSLQGEIDEMCSRNMNSLSRLTELQMTLSLDTAPILSLPALPALRSLDLVTVGQGINESSVLHMCAQSYPLLTRLRVPKIVNKTSHANVLSTLSLFSNLTYLDISLLDTPPSFITQSLAVSTATLILKEEEEKHLLYHQTYNNYLMAYYSPISVAKLPLLRHLVLVLPFSNDTLCPLCTSDPFQDPTFFTSLFDSRLVVLQQSASFFFRK